MLGCEIGFGFLHRISGVEEVGVEETETVEKPSSQPFQLSSERPTTPPPQYNQVMPSTQDVGILLAFKYIICGLIKFAL